jgi:hypothetical protein
MEKEIDPFDESVEDLSTYLEPYQNNPYGEKVNLSNAEKKMDYWMVGLFILFIYSFSFFSFFSFFISFFSFFSFFSPTPHSRKEHNCYCIENIRHDILYRNINYTI